MNTYAITDLIQKKIIFTYFQRNLNTIYLPELRTKIKNNELSIKTLKAKKLKLIKIKKILHIHITKEQSSAWN